MELSVESIQDYIYQVREFQVILDNDLAAFYQTKTKILNQAVNRKIDRFPLEFRFQLTKADLETIPNRGGIVNSKRRTLPFGFTQAGIGMLSGLLNTPRAIQVNVMLMRAFGHYRRAAATNFEIVKRLERLEQNSQQQFKIMVEMLQNTSNQKINNGGKNNLLLLPMENETTCQIDKIKNAVALFFRIKVDDLTSPKRDGSIVLPRQIAIFLVRDQVGLSFNKIGQCFGNKDHSTIMHSVKKIRISLEGNRKIQEAINSIKNSMDPPPPSHKE